MNEYTAVIEQDGDWWIGWIEEVPGVNCQEATYEELKETLKVTLEEILTLQDYTADEWDRQIESDIRGGTLDKLANEALAEHRERNTRET